jgi:hypothetical protein
MPGEAALRRDHVVGRLDLDAKVVQSVLRVGVLDQDQLQRRLGDREVRIALAPLGRLRAEHLRVERHRLVDVRDVQCQLHPARTDLLTYRWTSILFLHVSTSVNVFPLPVSWTPVERVGCARPREP